MGLAALFAACENNENEGPEGPEPREQVDNYANTIARQNKVNYVKMPITSPNKSPKAYLTKDIRNHESD